MQRTGLCEVELCKQPAVTSLLSQQFCLAHFIAHCYQRLDHCSLARSRPPGDFQGDASLRHFLEECSRRAVDICFSAEDLDNVKRSQLLDILLWAADVASECSIPSPREV